MRQTQPLLSKILYSLIGLCRRSTYALLGFLDRSVLKRQPNIFVLSYHSVTTDDWRFSVNASVLKKQIAYLKKNFDIISLKTLEEYIKGQTKIDRPSVVLTFDDGYKDILTMKEYFEKQNIKPALFVLANTKHPNWTEIGSKREFLTKRDIQALHKAGWEIGCHSATHSNLATLSDTALHEEIITAKQSLEKDLGIPFDYFAYPRGKYNKVVLQYVKKAKYTMALTMDDGFIKPKIDLMTVPRVGVDRTHTFSEFINSFTPSVIQVRKLVKDSIVGRYL